MLVGLTAGFLTGLLGWQINLISIHRGIDLGRRAGFLLGLGAVIGDCVWISIAFAGSQTLLSTHAELMEWLKWLGVFTLTFAGLKILFHNSQKKAEPEGSHWGHTKNLLIGFLVVIGNPILLILWIGVSSMVLTNQLAHLSPLEAHLLFLFGFAAGGTAWYLILFTLIFPIVCKWSDRRFHMISKFFAALLLLGAGLLIYKLLQPAS